MSEEIEQKNVETEIGSRDRKRRGDAITGGLFLICLGVLMITGYWWPGIMFALGLSAGAGLIFRGKTWSGVAVMGFFFLIPVFVWAVQETQIPWAIVAPLLLISIGVIILVKVTFLRD